MRGCVLGRPGCWVWPGHARPATACWPPWPIDPAVALAAAGALGRIDDPANAGDLLVALDHPEEQVRVEAARALGLMQHEPAVEPLGEMLLSGSGAEVSAAADALGQIGSPAAVDALLVALADPDLTSRRHAALGALESMGDRVVGPLAAMLASDSEPAARRNAAEALGWIGSPRATGALVAALKDRDEAVRRQAAWALGETGDPAARAALQRAISRDESALVQAEAQSALDRLAAAPASGVASRPVSLAAALDRLQPARWLLLVGTWAAAAWLAVTGTRLRPAAAVSKR
jgi:HEAT repeat protein